MQAMSSRSLVMACSDRRRALLAVLGLAVAGWPARPALAAYQVRP